MERMHEVDQNGNTLDSLFVSYREACPAPEGSSDFMPGLWHKIEARRVETTSIFKRLVQVCVAATAVVVVILATFMMPSSQDNEAFYSSTYSDVLVADHADQAYVQALPADLPGVY